MKACEGAQSPASGLWEASQSCSRRRTTPIAAFGGWAPALHRGGTIASAQRRQRRAKPPNPSVHIETGKPWPAYVTARSRSSRRTSPMPQPPVEATCAGVRPRRAKAWTGAQSADRLWQRLHVQDPPSLGLHRLDPAGERRLPGPSMSGPRRRLGAAEKPAASALPVMVWIHGGGLVSGSGTAASDLLRNPPGRARGGGGDLQLSAGAVRLLRPPGPDPGKPQRAPGRLRADGPDRGAKVGSAQYRGLRRRPVGCDHLRRVLRRRVRQPADVVAGGAGLVRKGHRRVRRRP